MEKTVETLSWNGFTYTVKPFNLGNLFSHWEGIAAGAESGKMFTGLFENSCKSLLEGATKEAQAFLISGELVKSILNSEDVEKAMDFKEKVDFFSNSFSKRADALKKSAPDLTDKLARKTPESLLRKSRKGTKDAHVRSI